MKFKDILLSYIPTRIHDDEGAQQALAQVFSKIPNSVFDADIDETVSTEKHLKGASGAIYVFGTQNDNACCFIEMYAFPDDDDPTIAVYATTEPTVNLFMQEDEKIYRLSFSLDGDTVKKVSGVKDLSPKPQEDNE